MLLAARSPQAQKIVTFDFRLFPDLAEMDGNWVALGVAHDGQLCAEGTVLSAVAVRPL